MHTTERHFDTEKSEGKATEGAEKRRQDCRKINKLNLWFTKIKIEK